jgi:ABC transport system ATP-binding/permease protein
MRAFLEAKKGPGQGRKITLREGQLLYVGRTEQADVSCPENPEMSAVHFSIRWVDDYCQFKDLNSANGSFCNGKRVQEQLVHHGDEIKAGQTTFRLVIGDAELPENTAPALPTFEPAPPPSAFSPSASSASLPLVSSPRKTTPPPERPKPTAPPPSGMP